MNPERAERLRALEDARKTALHNRNAEIVALRAEGETLRAIADAVGLTAQGIDAIVRAARV